MAQKRGLGVGRKLCGRSCGSTRRIFFTPRAGLPVRSLWRRPAASRRRASSTAALAHDDRVVPLGPHRTLPVVEPSDLLREIPLDEAHEARQGLRVLGEQKGWKWFDRQWKPTIPTSQWSRARPSTP